jgi:hypothetical protein
MTYEEKLRLEYEIIARADHLAVVNCKAKTARAEGKTDCYCSHYYCVVRALF